MNQPILHTQDLQIGYKNAIASNVNLSLQPGKLVALIGANGIGKSTLLRTLTKIQPPISGNVYLGGKPISDYSSAERARQFSIVLTEKLPPSNLTAWELVALGRQPYTDWIGKLSDVDRQQITPAMALTQVTDLADKRHFTLSDGQLQKVSIARALAQDTPLIVLDEPTTHLDLVHKVSLLRLLKKLTLETQKCVLFSTHDIDLALELSDEMIVMSPQKTIQAAPSQLISDGVFDTIFKDEHIVFDVGKGKFIFRNL